MSDLLGGIAGGLLRPLEDADRILAGALDYMGQAVEEGGEELQAAARIVASLAEKISALQDRLKGSGA